MLKAKEKSSDNFFDLDLDSSCTTCSDFSKESPPHASFKKDIILQLKKSTFHLKKFSDDYKSDAQNKFTNFGFGSFGEDFNKNYKVIEVLGKGHQGTVIKLKDLKTSEFLAAKILNLKDEELNMTLKNEYSLLSSINHPNILKVKELIVINDSPIMMMEFLESYLSLKDFINENSPLSQTQITSIFTQIASGVSYLHDKKIIHRDLHISNIQIHPQTLHIKIIDFGLAKKINTIHKSYDSLQNAFLKLSEDVLCDMQTPTGIPCFRAPEMSSQGCYSYKFDIWMIGLALFALINGEYLSTMAVIRRMAKTGEDKFNNQNFDIELKMALVGCLKKNPFERLNSAELMELLNTLNKK